MAVTSLRPSSLPAANRRTLIGLSVVAMVAAPVLIAVGNALHPVADTIDQLLDAVTAAPQTWLIAKLTYCIGSLLLMFAVAGVVRGFGGVPVLVGAILAGVGGAFNALSQALTGYTAYTAVTLGLDPASAETLLVGYDELGAAGVPVSFASVPLMALGLLILSIALLVRRDGPRVAGLLLLVGVVASPIVGAGPFALLAGAPLIVGFVMLARQRVARPEAGTVG